MQDIETDVTTTVLFNVQIYFQCIESKALNTFVHG